MGDEIEKFMKVWISAILCLCYCYYIASKIPKGFLRLLSILPILHLFIILPLNLSSPTLVGCTSFFLVWLGTFKLILFSFNQGPLALSPNIVHFISIASLPITPKQHSQTNQNNTTNKPEWLLLVKVLIFVMIAFVYQYKDISHPDFMLVIYCCHVYLSLELVLGFFGVIARIVFGFEIEPHFNEPYLCTSFQDFWGRRWNLMVSRSLRATVYNPICRMSTSLLGPSFATPAAMLATFLVSGLMHELIFYYLTRAPPTWEVTCFFVFHGVCTIVEVALKKVVFRRGWQLPRAVSAPLVVVFLVATARWLFFPQLFRNEYDKKSTEEYVVFVNFVKSKLPLHMYNTLG